jgi:hypothetical protein
MTRQGIKTGLDAGDGLNDNDRMDRDGLVPDIPGWRVGDEQGIHHLEEYIPLHRVLAVEALRAAPLQDERGKRRWRSGQRRGIAWRIALAAAVSRPSRRRRDGDDDAPAGRSTIAAANTAPISSGRPWIAVEHDPGIVQTVIVAMDRLALAPAMAWRHASDVSA